MYCTWTNQGPKKTQEEGKVMGLLQVPVEGESHIPYIFWRVATVPRRSYYGSQQSPKKRVFSLCVLPLTMCQKPVQWNSTYWYTKIKSIAHYKAQFNGIYHKAINYTNYNKVHALSWINHAHQIGFSCYPSLNLN